MKNKFWLIIVLFTPQLMLSQVSFDQHTISHNLVFPVAVFAADMDGDGDSDIICGDQGSESVVWFENIDGNGMFDQMHIVANGFDSLFDIQVFDIDGDADLDIVTSETSVGGVAWFENLDGFGNFGPKIPISDIEVSCYGVDVVDLDGDNDLDVLTTSRTTPDGSYWHENLDGLGDFGPAISLIETSAWPKRVKAADIDGDGDNDPILSNSLGNLIEWAENLDGQGAIGSPLIVTNSVEMPIWIHPVDFDQDNDTDIISTNLTNNGEIVWLRNTNGLGNFELEIIKSDLGYRPWCIYPVDFDMDGDLDILYTGIIFNSSSGAIFWIENLGNETFGSAQTIEDNNYDYPRSIFIADFDGDGDSDFAVTAAQSNRVAWFENLSPTLGINDNAYLHFSILPNPVREELNIICTNDIRHIEIFDLLGKKVFASTELSLKIGTLANGLYAIILTDVNGLTGIQKLIIDR